MLVRSTTFVVRLTVSACETVDLLNKNAVVRELMKRSHCSIAVKIAILQNGDVYPAADDIWDIF